MTLKALPNFEEITQHLESADLFSNASEVHGVLAGLVCGGVKLDNKSWKPIFNDVVNNGESLPPSIAALITSIYQHVVTQFNDDGLGFNLLLPDDNTPLDEQAEAVAQWSQGFLAGFGMVQQNLNRADSDINELIKDIRDISQVSLDFEQEDEESKIAFSEIVEYLRVAAMYCFNTFSRSPKAPMSKTLH